MQFFVLALAVGMAAASTMPLGVKVLTADLSELHTCTSEAECTQFPTTPKCDTMFKLCRPDDVPMVKEMEGDCTTDAQCTNMMRRCSNGKCAFTGPKACMAKTDCLQGVAGKEYDCVDQAESAPGKRCFMKCTDDTMCHERIPDELKGKIGCCGGFCQRKSAC